MTYFKGIKTIEDLKEKYRDLCKQLHPDNGGDTRAFQDMRNEFSDLCKTLKNVHRKDQAAQEQENDDTEDCPEAFADIIAKVAGFDGVDIEIIGRWVWLSGNTYQYRDGIKAAGFFWSSKHKKWYWNGGRTKSKKHSKMKMDAIKFRYGCTKVKAGHAQARLATA